MEMTIVREKLCLLRKISGLASEKVTVKGGGMSLHFILCNSSAHNIAYNCSIYAELFLIKPKCTKLDSTLYLNTNP